MSDDYLAHLVEPLDIEAIVQDIRWLHRLTIGEVADALDVHRQTLYAWRRGEARPSYTHEVVLRALKAGKLSVKRHANGDLEIIKAITPHIPLPEGETDGEQHEDLDE